MAGKGGLSARVVPEHSGLSSAVASRPPPAHAPSPPSTWPPRSSLQGLRAGLLLPAAALGHAYSSCLGMWRRPCGEPALSSEGWLRSSSGQRAGLAGFWDPAGRLAVSTHWALVGLPRAGAVSGSPRPLLCPTACLPGLSIKGLLSRGAVWDCLPGPGLLLALSACQGPRGTFCGTLQAPEPSA